MKPRIEQGDADMWNSIRNNWAIISSAALIAFAFGAASIKLDAMAQSVSDLRTVVSDVRKGFDTLNTTVLTEQGRNAVQQEQIAGVQAENARQRSDIDEVRRLQVWAPGTQQPRR